MTTDFGAELSPPADRSGTQPDAGETTGADPLNAKLAIAVTTDSGAAPAPPSASTCAVYRDAIELGLSRGRNAMAIWQDLVDPCGFTGGYQSVKRFVRKLVGSPSKEACAVIETAPGEEAQVDYGTGPMVRDARSGKYRRMRRPRVRIDLPKCCSYGAGQTLANAIRGVRRAGIGVNSKVVVALTSDELWPTPLSKSHSKALEPHALLVGDEVIQCPLDIDPLNHERCQL